jgi:hypothetical protein
MSQLKLPMAGLVLACALAWLHAAPALAFAPRLYSQGAYQSPVRAEPDDLLMLAGDGLGADDQVVYQAFPPGAAEHPTQVPPTSSPLLGTAPIVSAAGTPYQVTIRLPSNLLAGHAYRLWVKNVADEWSNGVSINDPRPMWISPAEVYATGAIANLPRLIKVIGRNMSAADSAPLQLRLNGPRLYDLSSVAAADTGTAAESATALENYVAKRALPKSLTPGRYEVELRMGDGRWTAVPDQALTVLPDPPIPREFPVSSASYGDCRPDDGRDDTPCVARAIEAARLAGGGAVIFEKGTWDLTAGALFVPPYVDLRGRGAAVTRIVRHTGPQAPAHVGEFVLLGHNTVRDMEFAEEPALDPRSSVPGILQLGRGYNTDERPQSTPSPVSDIIITRNVFAKTHGAIVDGGSSIERLFVTYNRLGDYRIGLYLGGNPYNVRSRFQITDSVIAHNEFMPGSYLNLEQQQGAMASELGASKRLDFSANAADGTNKSFLNSPDDAAGWRAAFFWHLHDSQEMLLISENNVSCSGDKAGDGEAISLDNNINTFALPDIERVIAATDDSVSVAGPLTNNQNYRDIDVNTFYVGHWLRIDSGPGIGQSRRIVSYRIDPVAAQVTFTVAPRWDVPPQTAVSRVSVERTFWQTLIVANTIDQRRPLCLKSNRTRPKGGNISVWAQATDSVIEGNRQFDTDGILFQQGYGTGDPACRTCAFSTTIPSFLEIRNNLIDGEYQWDSACSLSGIMGSYAASESTRSPPPLLSFGVSIARNRIVHADSLYGGAINIVPTWFRGPPGYAKPLVAGITIHHNEIRDIAGPAPRTACGYTQSGRFGIAVQGDRSVDATVLYKNSCDNVATPLLDRGIHTRRLCDQSTASSCECSH